MVGPTVDPPLIDFLLRFRTHHVALIADVTKMYRAVELTVEDRDLHRFVWRRNKEDSLQDYRMKHITFGVSASCLAVKRNAKELKAELLLAAQAVVDSFYVDDGLTGAEDAQTAIILKSYVFARAEFQLKKWNSSDPAVTSTIPDDLKEVNKEQPSQAKTANLPRHWGLSGM